MHPHNISHPLPIPNEGEEEEGRGVKKREGGFLEPDKVHEGAPGCCPFFWGVSDWEGRGMNMERGREEEQREEEKTKKGGKIPVKTTFESGKRVSCSK